MEGEIGNASQRKTFQLRTEGEEQPVRPGGGGGGSSGKEDSVRKGPRWERLGPMGEAGGLWRHEQGRIRLAKNETRWWTRMDFHAGSNENVLSWEGAQICR